MTVLDGKKLGFGCMRLPVMDQSDRTSIDMDQFKKMADLFLDRGFTYFDTAYMYHNHQSEIAVREAVVKRHPRDSFTLASKLPTMFLKEEDDLPRIFDEQLTKCGVDFFDYYLLHNLNVGTWPTAQKLKAFEFIVQKRKEGKIRHIGFSFHDSPALLEEILSVHPETEFVQMQLNYLDWDNEGVQSGKCYQIAQGHGKPVVVMEPVRGGALAQLPVEAERILRSLRPDWSPASWAIRYAASLDGVRKVLSGMSSLSQLDDNTASMKEFQPLTKEERSALQQVVETVRQAWTIPCTGCQYCVAGCPKHILIPTYFALYNTKIQCEKAKSGFSSQGVYYRNYTASAGKASDCIKCRACERSCPQHIKVSEWMTKVAEMFESKQ